MKNHELPSIAYWYIDSNSELTPDLFQKYLDTLSAPISICKILFSDIKFFPSDTSFIEGRADLILFDSKDTLILEILSEAIKLKNQFGKCRAVLWGSMDWKALKIRFWKENIECITFYEESNNKSNNINRSKFTNITLSSNQSTIEDFKKNYSELESKNKYNESHSQHKIDFSPKIKNIQISDEINSSKAQSEKSSSNKIQTLKSSTNFELKDGAIINEESSNNISNSNNLLNVKNKFYLNQSNDNETTLNQSEEEIDNTIFENEIAIENNLQIDNLSIIEENELQKESNISLQHLKEDLEFKEIEIDLLKDTIQNSVQTQNITQISDNSINWHEWGVDEELDIDKLRIMMSGKNIMSLKEVLDFCHNVYEVSKEYCENEIKNLILNKKKVFRVDKSNNEIFVSLRSNDSSDDFDSEEDSILVESKRIRNQTDKQITAIKQKFQKLITEDNSIESSNTEINEVLTNDSTKKSSIESFQSNSNSYFTQNKDLQQESSITNPERRSKYDNYNNTEQDLDKINRINQEVIISNQNEYNYDSEDLLDLNKIQNNQNNQNQKNQNTLETQLRIPTRNDLPLIIKIVEREKEIELEDLKDELKEAGISTTHLELFLIPYFNLFNIQQNYSSCIISLNK